MKDGVGRGVLWDLGSVQTRGHLKCYRVPQRRAESW